MTQEQRDSELRGSLLNHARLKASRDPEGLVSGSHLMLAARDRFGVGFSAGDEAHPTRLLTDLVSLHLLSEETPVMKGLGSSTLSHRRFGITDLGRKYCIGVIPPMPSVEVA